MRVHFLALAAMAALSITSPAQAATLIVDVNGHLTGATNVDVLGTLYDVSLVEGSCASLFGGCDESSDFAFNSDVTAMFAAQALLDQVFLGPPNWQFRDDPSLIFGCQDALLSCGAIVPYQVPLNSLFADARLAHVGLLDNDEVRGPNGILISFDTTSENSLDGLVYARFTPVEAPIPEPATWAMMSLGFIAVGFAMRRNRSPANDIVTPA